MSNHKKCDSKFRIGKQKQSYHQRSSNRICRECASKSKERAEQKRARSTDPSQVPGNILETENSFITKTTKQLREETDHAIQLTERVQAAASLAYTDLNLTEEIGSVLESTYGKLNVIERDLRVTARELVDNSTRICDRGKTRRALVRTGGIVKRLAEYRYRTNERVNKLSRFFQHRSVAYLDRMKDNLKDVADDLEEMSYALGLTSCFTYY